MMSAPKRNLPISRRGFLAATAMAAAVGAGSRLAASQDSPHAPSNSPGSRPPITRILADWAANCAPADVPDSTRTEAVRTIVNWIAATVGGSQQPAVDCVLTTLASMCCPSGAHLFGRSEQLDPLRAALVMGVSSHVLDFDDTDLATIIHPAGPVASALFALCQTHPMSGAEMLHAF